MNGSKLVNFEKRNYDPAEIKCLSVVGGKYQVRIKYPETNLDYLLVENTIKPFI